MSLGPARAESAPPGSVSSASMRLEVTFFGRVQGVGFRATAKSLARDHDVAGWIRNEPDGSVRLVIEGEESAVQGFMDALRDRVSEFVREETVERKKDRGSYSGFEIRY